MLEEDTYIGEKIRQFRIIKHVSQEELGNELNLNKQAVSRIEKGIRRVSHSELVKIAEFLKEPIESFIERELKFKLIQGKNAIVSIPMFAIDFIKDYKLFLDQKDLNPDAVRLIYKEITERMHGIFMRRFSLWDRL